MGPCRHWVVLGSFTPRPLLWDSELSSIRVKRFLQKSNFRFSKILSPGEPLQSRWSLATSEDFEDTLQYSLETLCPLLLQFPSTEISLGINTYTRRPYFIPSRSCYYKIPREYFVPTALQFFATWIPLRIISRTYRVSTHPQLFMCFTKFFEIIFDIPKILSSLLLLKFLLACIMVNPISIVILFASFVTIILSPLIQ